MLCQFTIRDVQADHVVSHTHALSCVLGCEWIHPKFESTADMGGQVTGWVARGTKKIAFRRFLYEDAAMLSPDVFFRYIDSS